jgi:hypothetical protein
MVQTRINHGTLEKDLEIIFWISFENQIKNDKIGPDFLKDALKYRRGTYV